MLTRRRALIGGGILAVMVAAALSAVVWYAVFRDDAPAEVSLGGAIASLATTATPSATTDAASGSAAGSAPSQAPAASPNTSATDAAPPSSTSPAAARPEGLTGRWVLAQNGESFVGYRVKEELARIGSATAVGRTKSITATLEFDGTAITAVRVTADLTRLQSDASLRDGALRTQALETNRFPTATFVLTQPIAIGAVPAEDVPLQTTATGDLTLHGVTRGVSIPVQGQRRDGFVVVVGSLEIRFADFGIAQPRAASVLSVEDRGILELQLIFQHQPDG